MLLELKIEDDLLEVLVKELSLILADDLHDVIARHFSVRVDVQLALIQILNELMVRHCRKVLGQRLLSLVYLLVEALLELYRVGLIVHLLDDPPPHPFIDHSSLHA